MSKIHITLVGGQTAPVYQGIVATNPDKVFFICSNQTTDEVSRIQSEISIESELKIFDPVDLLKIENSINSLKLFLRFYDNITINVGGGTKAWSIIFYASFSSYENVELFYIDQNNLMWDLKTKQSRKVDFDFDVHFKLHGNVPKSFKRLDMYSETDRLNINKIKEVRKFNYREFNYLTSEFSKIQNVDHIRSLKISDLFWNSTENTFRFSINGGKNGYRDFIIKSENVKSLIVNSGWFEFEVALFLSKWSGNKQMLINCVFNSKNESPKNEIDIIINTGSKLLFVECKTQIKNETDIDKFASAVKVYGGLGSKSLFVTDNAMTTKALEKCNDHGIMTYNMQNNILPGFDKLLFSMLDKEMLNTNTK